MINKLVKKIQQTKAPVVVGLDPMLSYVPEHILKKSYGEFGETLAGAADAIWQFNKEIVDKTWDLIPAVKPQIAMYEQFGVEGLKAFEKTVSYCQEKDLVVIADIKRGDIGSTSGAYAVGHVGRVKVGSKEYAPFHEDFVTLNPYMGIDSVKPFLYFYSVAQRLFKYLVQQPAAHTRSCLIQNPKQGRFALVVARALQNFEICSGMRVHKHIGTIIYVADSIDMRKTTFLRFIDITHQCPARANGRILSFQSETVQRGRVKVPVKHTFRLGQLKLVLRILVEPG